MIECLGNIVLMRTHNIFISAKDIVFVQKNKGPVLVCFPNNPSLDQKKNVSKQKKFKKLSVRPKKPISG